MKRSGTKKEYALIWWTNSGCTDIVDLNVFPKKSRCVGAKTKLIWVNHVSGSKERSEAEILKISDDRNELNKMIVTDKGKIHDPKDKIFSKEVIDERTSHNQNKKLMNSVIKSRKREFEDAVQKNISIVPNVSQLSMKKGFSGTSMPLVPGTQDTVFPPFDVHSIRPQLPTVQPRRCSLQPNTHAIRPMVSIPLYQNYSLQRKGQLSSPSFTCSSKNITANVTIPILETLEQENFDSFTSPANATSEQNSNLNENANSDENVYPAHESSKQQHDHNCLGKYSIERHLVDNEDTNSCSENVDSLSEGEELDGQIKEGAVRAMAATFPGKITKRDIAFQELLLAAMKHNYETAHKMKLKSTKKFEIPAHFLQPALNMEELSPHCGFFMDKDKLSVIKLRAENESKNEGSAKWKVLVREVLLEVYGSTIANYSATGKRSERPPIHSALFKGLLDLAIKVSKGTLTKATFTQYVNKSAFNKRKHKKQTASKLVSNSPNPKLKQMGTKNQVIREIAKEVIQDSRPSAENANKFENNLTCQTEWQFPSIAPVQSASSQCHQYMPYSLEQQDWTLTNL